ncbi:hypothetical protein [Paraburkholderia sp. SIMBA_054]|uniref:hypothetical protein n=1 Tax=Paraburkholderia sp. SIMBA_054 TaxID=3085795 RepID=UPI003979D465
MAHVDPCRQPAGKPGLPSLTDDLFWYSRQTSVPVSPWTTLYDFAGFIALL